MQQIRSVCVYCGSAGAVDQRYRAAADRGWSVLTKAVETDGKLGWVQQVGSQPDEVGPDHTQPFGVGAFLLAGGAMYDLVGQQKHPANTKR